MFWHGWWRESLFFNLCTGTKHGCLQAKHVNHVFKTSFSDSTGYCKDITRPASPEHEDIQTKTLQLNSKLPFLWNFRGFSPCSELQHYNLSVGEGGSRLFRSFRRCTGHKSDRSLGHKQIEYKSELSLPWSYNKRYQEEVWVFSQLSLIEQGCVNVFETSILTSVNSKSVKQRCEPCCSMLFPCPSSFNSPWIPRMICGARRRQAEGQKEEGASCGQTLVFTSKIVQNLKKVLKKVLHQGTSQAQEIRRQDRATSFGK